MALLVKNGVISENILGNRELVQQLVFEAKVTEWFTRNSTFTTKEERG